MDSNMDREFEVSVSSRHWASLGNALDELGGYMPADTVHFEHGMYSVVVRFDDVRDGVQLVARLMVALGTTVLVVPIHTVYD